MECGGKRSATPLWCQTESGVALRLPPHSILSLRASPVDVVKMQSVHYPSAAMKKIRIAQFGLGPIGIETLKLVATKPWAEIVGGIDIDPQKTGKDLAELAQAKELEGKIVHHSLKELAAFRKPDVIFHTTVSRFRDAYAQIEPMARMGISVVLSCEELLFLQLREPQLAAKL